MYYVLGYPAGSTYPAVGSTMVTFAPARKVGSGYKLSIVQDSDAYSSTCDD